METRRPFIVLLSAYRADSHARWADFLLRSMPEVEWRRFELPGRHFAWRIRGNPLGWLDELDGIVPDALVATSMVDLATIRGLHPALAGVPALLYFHENQFAYPRSDRQTTSVDAQMVQLYAALAADRVLFNSRFNRTSFLRGLDQLMARMPDHVPSGLVERLAQKSAVLPVPIDPILPAENRDSGLIVWNHRWEYDKNPDRFADAMIALAERGVAFRLALLGSRARRVPPALARLREALPERIVVDGALPIKDYRATLGRGAIAVSTALHEFQGLAMLEAASAGCLPLVPDALCYPEIYPAEYRYAADQPRALEQRLGDWLLGSRPVPFDPCAWTASRLTATWRDALSGAVGERRDGR